MGCNSFANVMRGLLLAATAMLVLIVPATEVKAQTVTGICSRALAVQTAILDATGRTTCSDVTTADLAAVTTLTVRSYGPTSIDPADFAGLTGLTSLTIASSPQLTTVPDNAFAGLTALTTLNFNVLFSLTTLGEDAFAGLTTLENLNLSSNLLTTLHADIFDGLTALSRLELQDNLLTTLDEDIFDDLTALTSLDLNLNTSLAALDADIFDGLTALEYLDLSYTNQTALDADIFDDLTALGILALSNNGLTTLDADLFDGLTALKELYLNSNLLTTLDADLFDGLTALDTLALNRNLLTTLDADLFDGLTALEELELNSNLFTTLDADIFGGLAALNRIELQDNRLTALDADIFDGLTALDTLALAYNGLTTLDADLFDGLTALRLLSLSGNLLTTLDADLFDGLTALDTLALNSNLFTTLDADLFDGLTALDTLALKSNLFTTLDADIFDGLTALKDLYLNSNLFTTLDADIFDGLAALNRIELQDNRLTALDADIFDGITLLDWLDLKCNYFTALDLDIFDPFAATLTYLDLMSDSFTTPPSETAIRAKFPMIIDALTGVTTCLRVTVSPTSLTVTEGATGTYTVALRAPPSDNVMVAISSDNSDVTVAPTTPLTFTASNWDTPQMVTVSAAQDTDDADESATLILDPNGSNYDFVSSTPLTVVVVDDDDPAVTTLVSNATQGGDASRGHTVDRSQAFTTSAGATLSSVEIISVDLQDDEVAVSLCTVDSSNHPTSDCTVLTAPSSFAHGTLVFTDSANTTLAANTTYALLVTSPSGDNVLLAATSSEGEDAGGATGWSIANTFYRETSPNVWVAVGRALRITIKGTITASSNNAPTVATAIQDQTATAGTAFSYAFPDTTFNDADSDTLTYTATKSDDTARPSWLSFTAATRAFSGTPQAADVETVSVKVTASDGNSGSVSDTFDIVVGLPGAITVPGVPTDLSASTGGDTRINLSWTAPGDDGGSSITGYKIEVSPDGNANWTELVTNTGNTTTTYAHSGLAVGTTRHYRVSAINSAGAGDPSNIDDATTRPITGPITGGGGGGGGGGPTPSDVDFEWNVKRDIEELDGGNDRATGVWSDGTTLWVADNADGAGDAVYAYDLASGERVEEREFELDERNRAPRGVWSDGETVWVSDSGRERLFAYRLADGERLEEREFALAERNSDVRGIWSDGETMWVLDGVKDSLFAYDIASGELLAEYELDAANDDPRGIWSDGVTIWVSDHGAKRLIAYRLPVLPDAETDPGEEDADDDARELERVRDEEFTELSKASNNSPRGIWSDGDVMYVADESDDRVYSYNMPDAIDARLASLSLSGVDIGEFSPSHEEYEGAAGEGVTETTVTAEAMQRRTDVDIDPPDADEAAEGYQVALEDLGKITVTVTSADGSRTKTYRVRLGEEEAAGPVASCLRGDIAVGFSLVVYAGGSIEDLVACAEDRNVAALYALDSGAFVSYILGAPDFVNADFRALFAEGLPALTPLVARSDGPATAAAVASAVTRPLATCLQGEIVEGFNLVLYEGGSVGDLEACAEGAGLASLYVLDDGVWVSHILGAPAFVNVAFRDLYAVGVPVVTPLVGKRN